eukprot:scaffold291836_cov42-Prasinocladus_malaysianus.AAC.1
MECTIARRLCVFRCRRDGGWPRAMPYLIAKPKEARSLKCHHLVGMATRGAVSAFHATYRQRGIIIIKAARRGKVDTPGMSRTYICLPK